MEIRIFLVQLKSKIGDIGYNLKRAKEIIVQKVLKDKSEADFNIAVFPELYLPGYLARDLHFKLAKTIVSPEIVALRKLIGGTNTFLIIGLTERDEAFSGIYNSALLLSPDGRYMFFRKRHLPTYGLFDEYRYFKPYRGDIDIFRIEKRWGIGVGICYDAFFPEISRIMLLKGALIHVYISAAPDMSKEYFEIFIRSRAMENTVYTVYVNTVGFYNGIGFFGGSFVSDPQGKIICKAKYFSEDIVSTVIDIDEIQYFREKRPIIRDISIWDIEDLRKTFLERR